MDPHYQKFYKQAAALQHNFHDYSHQMAHDPSAIALSTQLHGLTHDIAKGRQPRVIENRIRKIQEHIQLAQATHPNSAMADMGHQLGPGMAGQMGMSPVLNKLQSATMHNNFESMRRTIRQHPNFR